VWKEESSLKNIFMFSKYGKSLKKTPKSSFFMHLLWVRKRDKSILNNPFSCINDHEKEKILSSFYKRLTALRWWWNPSEAHSYQCLSLEVLFPHLAWNKLVASLQYDVHRLETYPQASFPLTILLFSSFEHLVTNRNIFTRQRKRRFKYSI